MSNPFTSDEIKKAVSKMRMNKSPGRDKIPVEQIMYAPNRIRWGLPKRNKPWNTSTIAKTWETKRTSIKPYTNHFLVNVKKDTRCFHHEPSW